MKAPVLLSLAALPLSGCAATDKEPGPYSIAALVDRLPVVPIQTHQGNGTGLLLADGSVLTCSHVFPRGEVQGAIRVTGPWISYRVEKSGDQLSGTWSAWSAGSARDVQNDWTIFAPSSPVIAETLFNDPIRVVLSPAPPARGDSLFLVGYTVEGGRFERCQVPLQVVEPPVRELAGSAFGVKAISGKAVRAHAPGAAVLRDHLSLGFSGAPIWRVRADGVVEACGMLVAAELDRAGHPTQVGVATGIPRLGDQRATK